MTQRNIHHTPFGTANLAASVRVDARLSPLLITNAALVALLLVVVLLITTLTGAG